jgi:hypothetical protein
MLSSPTVTLCGPQRLAPTIGAMVKDVGASAPVAVITAGWRERETDDDELSAAVGLQTINLGLYRRWRTIAEADSAYFDLHRERQDLLRALQRVYRVRLRHLMNAVRAVNALTGDAALLEPEVRAAIDMIGALDRHHLDRVKQVHVEFENRVKPGSHPVIAKQRDEVSELLEGVDTVLIAGGHVAVLLNRLRLLGLRPHLEKRHVIAWSAGAMAMTSHVLLFHDFPPWGEGDAEVLDHGLGLASGIVALPHAHRRLALDDRSRVAAMARRAAPSVCVTLADGARVVTRSGKVLAASEGVMALRDTGEWVVLPVAEVS